MSIEEQSQILESSNNSLQSAFVQPIKKKYPEATICLYQTEGPSQSCELCYNKETCQLVLPEVSLLSKEELIAKAPLQSIRDVLRSRGSCIPPDTSEDHLRNMLKGYFDEREEDSCVIRSLSESMGRKAPDGCVNVGLDSISHLNKVIETKVMNNINNYLPQLQNWVLLECYKLVKYFREIYGQSDINYQFIEIVKGKCNQYSQEAKNQLLNYFTSTYKSSKHTTLRGELLKQFQEFDKKDEIRLLESRYEEALIELVHKVLKHTVDNAVTEILYQVRSNLVNDIYKYIKENYEKNFTGLEESLKFIASPVNIPGRVITSLSVLGVGTGVGLATGFAIYTGVVTATGAASAGIGIAVGIALLPLVGAAILLKWSRSNIQKKILHRIMFILTQTQEDIDKRVKEEDSFQSNMKKLKFWEFEEEEELILKDKSYASNIILSTENYFKQLQNEIIGAMEQSSLELEKSKNASGSLRSLSSAITKIKSLQHVVYFDFQ